MYFTSNPFLSCATQGATSVGRFVCRKIVKPPKFVAIPAVIVAGYLVSFSFPQIINITNTKEAMDQPKIDALDTAIKQAVKDGQTLESGKGFQLCYGEVCYTAIIPEFADNEKCGAAPIYKGTSDTLGNKLSRTILVCN